MATEVVLDAQNGINENQLEKVLRKGEAPIKKEYLIVKNCKKTLNLNFVSEEDKERLKNKQENDTKTDKIEVVEDEPKAKRLKGMNKDRKIFMNENKTTNSEVKLCSKYAGSYGLSEFADVIEQCPFGDKCKFSHDLDAYLKSQPKYIDKNCYIFDKYGFCGYGHRCKFATSHIEQGTQKNIVDHKKFLEFGPKFNESYKNFISTDTKLALRKKKYDFSCLEEKLGPASLEEKEWKKVDFTNKLYLAPLTTVGNLPFRRVCKEYGADITCGEMAIAKNIVEGSLSEWALLRRHASEDIFGVQLCGYNPQILAKATKLINDHCNVDFIDLNMGCPLDFIYKNGAGCGLMPRANKVSQVITSMSRVSNVPITLKMRSGIYENKPIADKLINMVTNQFSDGRIGLITIHGRSREARYTKRANWDYIRQCAASRKNELVPLFGSGDILSYEDYDNVMNCENNQLSGVMIGRGALIKPWIFTEIKEKRSWDISSSERKDMLQKFVNYGLEQWGSDHDGVEKTRKFLLEWLSFLFRYIPVALLEVLPQNINDRPPLFKGRDDLETLMASPYCEDWIKITELFLGPVKSDYLFLPKHKANAYSS